MKLKSILYLIAGLALLITLATGGALALITTEMRQEAQDAEGTGNLIISAQNVIRAVGRSSRLTTAWIMSGGDDLRLRRDRSRRDSFDILAQLKNSPLSLQDREFLDDLTAKLQKMYFDQDQYAMKSAPKNPAQTSKDMSGLIDKMTQVFDPFIRQKSQKLLGLSSKSLYYEKISNGVALTAAGCSILLFVILISILQFSVVRPLSGLLTTMIKFHGGDKKARVKIDGGKMNEVRSAATAFNDLADSIEKLDRRRIEYLVGVAHDLKNPVTAMKTAIGLLKSKSRQLAPERAHELLNLISLQTTRLERMITDWMEVQRIEDGELEYRVVLIDIREIVKECVLLWQGEEKAQRMKIACTNSPVLVKCDPGRIARVINNLLSNALKYSPNGGAIDVHVDQEDSYASISIIDHGMGISEHDLSHLFEPFRRSIAVRDIPGVGIGLSTSRKLIKAHGGEISVRSQLGHGSTFIVRLPLADAAKYAQERSA